MKRLANDTAVDYIESLLAKGNTIVLYDKKFLDIWYVHIDGTYNNGDYIDNTYLVDISFFDIESQEFIQEESGEISASMLEDILKEYGEIIAYL